MMMFPNISYFRILDVFFTDIVVRFLWLFFLYICFQVTTKTIKKEYKSPALWLPKSAFSLAFLIVFVEHFLIFFFGIIGKFINGRIGYLISPFNAVARNIQAILFAFVVIILLTYIVRIKYKQPISILGFEKNRIGHGVIWGISVTLLYCWLIVLVFKSLFETDYEAFTKTIHYHLSLPAVLSMLAFTPIMEELTCRGFIYQAFRKKLPFSFSAVFSSLLFVILHAHYAQVGYIIGVFIAGMVAAFLFYKSHSIISCIMLHMGINTMGLLRSYNNGYFIETITWSQVLISGFVIFLTSSTLIMYLNRKMRI